MHDIPPAATPCVFISHTTRDPRDHNFAGRISTALREMGVPTWIAPDDIPPGADWHAEVVTAVTVLCTHFLVVLSAASIATPWVLDEISLAERRNSEDPSFKVFPIEAGTLTDYAGREFLDSRQKVPYSDDAKVVARFIVDEIISAPASTARFARKNRTRPLLLGGGLTLALIASAVILINHADATSVAGSRNTVTATIPVGQYPNGVAIAPDNSHAYVVNLDNLSVIDTGSHMVTTTIPIGTGQEDNGGEDVAITPDGRHVYVTNNGHGQVSVIDTATNSVTATILTYLHPEGVAITPDGRYAYIANTGTQTSPGNTVSVVDTTSNAIIATVTVKQYPANLAISRDGSRVYLAGSGSVSVIDAENNSVSTVIPVGPYANGIAVTPDGHHLYVTDGATGSVSVIDTATNKVTKTIPVGRNPLELAITPDGRYVYVPNFNSNTVSVIDTVTNSVTATIGVDQSPLRIAISSDGLHAYVTNQHSNVVSVINVGRD